MRVFHSTIGCFHYCDKKRDFLKYFSKIMRVFDITVGCLILYDRSDKHRSVDLPEQSTGTVVFY